MVKSEFDGLDVFWGLDFWRLDLFCFIFNKPLELDLLVLMITGFNNYRISSFLKSIFFIKEIVMLSAIVL